MRYVDIHNFKANLEAVIIQTITHQRELQILNPYSFNLDSWKVFKSILNPTVVTSFILSSENESKRAEGGSTQGSEGSQIYLHMAIY